MNGITTVFFDAGGTLVKPKEDVGQVYARTGRRYGLDVDSNELLASFLATFHEQKLDGLPQDKRWWQDVVGKTFGRFGGGSDPLALFEELYAHFTDPASWELFPCALDTILELKRRGYGTALISNWDDRLPELLEGLGLLSQLAPRVISYRVGVEKPHRRIFETALAEAEVEPAEALMVGDDWEADIVGARALGMPAVYVERHGHAAPDGPSIEHLEGLLDLLPPEGGAQGVRQTT